VARNNEGSALSLVPENGAIEDFVQRLDFASMLPPALISMAGNWAVVVEDVARNDKHRLAGSERCYRHR